MIRGGYFDENGSTAHRTLAGDGALTYRTADRQLAGTVTSIGLPPSDTRTLRSAGIGSWAT